VGAIEARGGGAGFDAREVFAVESVEDAADFVAQIVAQRVMAEEFPVRQHGAIPIARGIGGSGQIGFVGVEPAGELGVFELAEDGVGFGVVFREVVAGAEKVEALVIAGVKGEVALREAEDGGRIFIVHGERGEGEERLAIGGIGCENFGGERLGEMGLVKARVEIDEVTEILDRELRGAVENFSVGEGGQCGRDVGLGGGGEAQ
jgi:hypothetical protein